MRLLKWMSVYLREMLAVMRHEVLLLRHDAGVLLVVVFALLIYGTLYALAYGRQVLRDVPIAVVDCSRTPSSRSLRTLFDASPDVAEAYDCADMAEAERLFYAREVYGVVYIPSDFERALMAGERPSVAVYCDAGYFLMYRALFKSAAEVVGEFGAKVAVKRLLAAGVDAGEVRAVAQPVIYESHTLYNPYLGYATFIMPAIILIIIQQTLLIGIGMVGGTWHEEGLYRQPMVNGHKRLSALAVVVGRTVVYAAIYALTATYMLVVHYRLFGYPMNGRTADCLAVVVPYVLASVLMGITLSLLFTRRESSLVWLLWSSVPVLLLSGASLPKEAFPEWMYLAGQILPSSSAVAAYVRVQTAGAPLSAVEVEVVRLWMLVLAYGVSAVVGTYAVIRRQGLTVGRDNDE